MIGFIETRDMYNIHDMGKFRSSGVKHVKTTCPIYTCHKDRFATGLPRILPQPGSNEEESAY